jgi:hypothetical protein
LAWVGCVIVLTFSILRVALHPFHVDSGTTAYAKPSRPAHALS